MSETTVPPNTKLGSPIANQVVGIQKAGCRFVDVLFSKMIGLLIMQVNLAKDNKLF